MSQIKRDETLQNFAVDSFTMLSCDSEVLNSNSFALSNNQQVEQFEFNHDEEKPFNSEEDDDDTLFPFLTSLSQHDGYPILTKPIDQGGFGFDDQQLINLVSNLHEKGISAILENLLDSLEKPLPLQNKFILRSVLEWMNDNTIDRFDCVPDSIRKARSDAKFEYLRGLEDSFKLAKFEKLVGKFIELPILGPENSQFVPKGFDSKQPFLLTQQAFDILSNIVTRNISGLVPSGPFGISKSYTMYLIACYAIVNSFPLLYIPRCGSLVKSFESSHEDGIRYLREWILKLNYDILSKDDVQGVKSTDPIYYLSTRVGNNKPVFYLLDDHQELFIDSIRKDFYLKDFKMWCGSTSGNKTITVYCGSAHSYFEENLPKGENPRIFRMQPFSKTEFETLLERYGFKLKDASKIELATGRIPGEIKDFNFFIKEKSSIDPKDVSSFISDRKLKYIKKIKRFTSECNEKELATLISSFKEILKLGLYGESCCSIYSLGSFCDLGILYEHERGVVPINESAKRAILEYYIENIPSSPRVIIRAGDPPIVQGTLFETCLIEQEFKHSCDTHFKRISFSCINNSSNELVDHISYSLKGGSFAKFDITNIESLSLLSRHKWNSPDTILFQPQRKNFPAIDYLIVTYHNSNNIQVVFKQIIVSIIAKHNRRCKKPDMCKLLDSKYVVCEYNNKIEIRKSKEETIGNDFKYSLFELLLSGILDTFQNSTRKHHNIFGIKNVKLLQKSITYQHTCSKQEELIRSLTFNLDNGPLTINWFFVYESAVPQDKQDIQISHGNINYRNREEITNDLGIHFLDI